MIKTETHAHLFYSSHCAKCPNEDMIKVYLENSYKAVVFTNHINKKEFQTNFGECSYYQYIEKWLNVIYKAKEEFKKAGIKTFWGAEVGTKTSENGKSEYTLIGIDERFLFDNKPLFDFNQEELFNLANENDVFMYQTHPFRDGITTGNPKFLHGAESYNEHHNHNSHNNLASEFCKKHNLVALAGNDYHDKGQNVFAGIYLPEDISTNKQLKDFYFKGKIDLFYDEEGWEKDHEIAVFKRQEYLAKLEREKLCK